MSGTNPPARSAKEQFDRQAEHYDTQWNAWSEESLRWLLTQGRPQPTDVALDVATGTGFTALAFAPYVLSMVGLDVSSGMLVQAQQRAAEQKITNTTFLEGVAESLPFPEAHFDLVTCRIAPHHFLNITQFAHEVARVLKPDGRFLLADTTVPDNSPEVDAWQNGVEALRDPSHVRNYTPEEWRTLLENAGLKVEQLNTNSTIPITLNDWMVKAGCTPEQSSAVRVQFENAPPSAVAAFQIERLPDADIRFIWQRVALKAIHS